MEVNGRLQKILRYAIAVVFLKKIDKDDIKRCIQQADVI